MRASIELPNAKRTRVLGAEIAKIVAPGDVVCISGDLGAGKTTLTQGLCETLGVTESVTSPTFSLIHEYLTGKFPVAHFDLYRLEGVDEVLALGYEEYLDGRFVVIIEWPDRLGNYLPESRIELQLEESNKGRIAKLTGFGSLSHSVAGIFGNAK